MNKRIYIIPVIIFLATVSVLNIAAAAHKSAIQEFVDKAGANGWPMIAVASNSPFYNAELITIDGSSVNLIPGNLDSLWNSMIYFEEDGMLVFITQEYTPYRNKSIRYNKYLLELPEFRLDRVESTKGVKDDHYDYYNNYALHYFTNYGLRHTIDFDRIESSINVTSLFGEDFQVPIGDHAPELVNAEGDAITLYFSINADLSTIFVLANSLPVNRASLGGLNVPSGSANPSATDKNELWSIDTESGQWTYITETKGMSIIAAGPDGKLLGVQNSFLNEVGFIDTETGLMEATSNQSYSPVVGNRWTVCMSSATSIYYNTGIIDLIIFDSQDSWVWHKVQIEPGWAPKVAMYEPPLNGLDGMYENYQPSGEQ